MLSGIVLDCMYTRLIVNIYLYRFLVHWGVDINAADSDGWTPLHCAASCNSVQMVKFLVENGAQIFAETYSDNETGKW